MKKLMIIALALAHFGCASAGLSLKQTTVISLQASTDALTDAQTLERSFCFINPVAESGLHCTNPIALQLGLTDAIHVKMATFFSDGFGVADRASLAIPLWKAGDPIPVTVLQYMTDVTALLNAVKTLDPALSPLTGKVQTAVNLGASVATAMGAK